MIEINQPILQNKNLYLFIETTLNIINSSTKFDYSIFFPKDKAWFTHYKQIFTEMLNDNKNFKSLISYKGKGYININKLLISKSLPFILLFNKYDKSNNLYNKTIINSNPIYIFPDDLEKISEYKKNNLIKHISNIDYLFTKYYNNLILSDCILFRGMSDTELPKLNSNSKTSFQNTFYNMTTKQSQSNKYKFNLDENNEFVFDNYTSTTFNIKTALNFASNVLLVLNIKKEHNIPGIYLSDLFFDNINNKTNLNNFFKIHDTEFEILLHRNLKIKIKKVKNVKIDKKYIFNESINSLYNKDKDTKNKIYTIKLVFAESCPFEMPQKFTLENDYKYICSRLEK